ncbi:hypothetical protein CFOL_v3_25635, partial [Cephalotus follicularis]
SPRTTTSGEVGVVVSPTGAAEAS